MLGAEVADQRDLLAFKRIPSQSGDAACFSYWRQRARLVVTKRVDPLSQDLYHDLPSRGGPWDSQVHLSGGIARVALC